MVFTPHRARAIIKYANVHMRAMVYLGLNCGWGNNDVSSVPISAFDLRRGFVDFPRPKTAIERRSPLWPETVAALNASFAKRHQPNDEANNELFFITLFGAPYVRQRPGGSWIDSVGRHFSRHLIKLNLKADGVNFYSLRHTFRTIADECEDQPAIDRIMGHETPGIGTVYRGWRKDTREDTRLKRITDHVREWLFPADLCPKVRKQFPSNA